MTDRQVILLGLSWAVLCGIVAAWTFSVGWNFAGIVCFGGSVYTAWQTGRLIGVGGWSS